MNLFNLGLISFSVAILCVSFFYIFKPAFLIEQQRKFYLRINWRIEPVSMKKELRNTRIMGFMLIAILLAVLFICFRNSGFKFK